MNRRNPDRGRWVGPCRILLTATAVVALCRPTPAALVLTSSAAQVVYSVNSTSSTGVAGGPQFSGDGVLLTPGGGLPILTGGAPGRPSQTFGTSSLATPFFTTASTTPQAGASGTVPSIFGTAGTGIFARGAGQQGALTSLGGIFFDTSTTLTDNLGPGDVNLASVTFAFAIATLLNNGPTAVAINPGALLSVRGTLGSGDSSYVAAGLVTRFTLPGADGSTTVTPIALAATRTGLTVFSSGNGPNDSAAGSLSGGRLFATASSFLNGGTVLVGAGQSISIQASLTLIADPGSTISLTTDLAPGFFGLVPDFGSNAGGPFAVAVPEPSASVLAGIGLATAAAWSRRGRRAGARARGVASPAG